MPLLSPLFISACLQGNLREATRSCGYRQVRTDQQLARLTMWAASIPLNGPWSSTLHC